MRKTILQCLAALLLAPVLTLVLVGTIALAADSDTSDDTSSTSPPGASGGTSSSTGSGGTSSSTGSGGTSSSTPPVTSPPLEGITLSLDKTSLSLKTGDTSQLNVSTTLTPAGADRPSLTYRWSSSDDSVATVSNGTVTAKSEGTATITVSVPYSVNNENKTATAECKVEVITKMSNVSISPTGPVVLATNERTTLNASTIPAGQPVTWTLNEDGEGVVRLSQTAGNTITAYALAPGRAVLTASIGSEGNYAEKTVVIEVSGIVLSTSSMTLRENEREPLPTATCYGSAKPTGIGWQTMDYTVAQVVNGQVVGQGPGSTTIVGYSGGYEVSFTVTVTSDSSTTIEAGTIKSSETLRFRDLSSQLRNLSGGKLAYLTNLSVPTSQGTLYYQYTSEAQHGSGVAQSGNYYLNPTSGQRGLEEITFVPKRSYEGGTVYISFNAMSDTGSISAGRIILTVNKDSTTAFSMQTKYNTPLQFSGAEFSQACREAYGESLSYVIFSLPNERQGTLYTDYVSTTNYGSKVTLNTRYSVKDLSNVWFVPAPGYTGRVTLYYNGYTAGDTGFFSGQVNIIVDTENSGSVGGPAYKVAPGGAVTFKDEDFNEYCQNILSNSERLNYIRFDQLPASTAGTLYYGYRSASSPGTLVTAGTTYYAGTYSPRLDRITFVPADGFTGTARIPFTGWTNTGTQFSGNVEVNVQGGTGSGDIHYTCAPGKTVRFNSSDFTALCRDLTGRTLDYLCFQTLPSSLDGVIYHGTTQANTSTNYRNSSSGYRISNLSFRASKNFSGSVDIPFVGYASGSGESFSGVITIDSNTSSSSDSRTLHYSTDYTSAAVFNRADFDDLSQWETDQKLSTIRFELPASSQGELYRGYRSASSKGTRLTSSTTSISASDLSRVAFVPASGYTGTVYLDFTAKALSDGGEFTGTVEITVDRPAPDVTVRYSTRISPVTFRSADFGKNGSTLSSIQFSSMLPSSAGYVYYQYVSPTRYGRQASAGTTYRVSGSNLISELTFVPRSGYSGTVTIPYTGTNSNNSTFEGEVVITVSPSYSSAYFNDLSGYTAEQLAAVDYLRENGITNGISATQFGPEASITRADFAVMLCTAFDLSYTGGSTYFNDVPAGSYYAQAVNALYSRGIVSGIGNGAYGSNYSLSRQDAICMIQRTMRTVGWSANDGYAGYLGSYSDSGSVAGYAQGAMAHAVQMGYLPLKNGLLAPRDPLTRVDMATILHRVMTY